MQSRRANADQGVRAPHCLGYVDIGWVGGPWSLAGPLCTPNYTVPGLISPTLGGVWHPLDLAPPDHAAAPGRRPRRPPPASLL